MRVTEPGCGCPLPLSVVSVPSAPALLSPGLPLADVWEEKGEEKLGLVIKTASRGQEARYCWWPLRQGP